MRWIYISPHLDDAVLSAGGLIHEQTRAGQPVEIWTCMCGFPPESELSPFAQLLHHQWGMSSAEQVVGGRRAEDLRAAALLGARAVHFDFFDCIYRRGKNGEWLYSDVFIPPHEEEAELAGRIAETISSRLQPGDKLVCQLAIGSHVDHVLVRRAVESLRLPLIYDADIPYHFNFPDELAQQTAGLKESLQSVTEPGLAAWQDAIGAYASQLGMLFETDDAMRAKIRQYWSENRGIRVWSPG